MKNEDNIELRSNDVKEIIGKTPPLILRMGLISILISIIVTIAITAFIETSESVEVEVIIEKNKNSFLPIMKIKLENIYLIKLGQNVLINTKQFPENEFGIINTKILNIDYNLKNSNNYYFIYCEPLYEIYNLNVYEMPFSQLNGTAKIEIFRKSLLMRLINF